LRTHQLGLRHAADQLRLAVDELRYHDVVARAHATVAQAQDDVRKVRAEVGYRRRDAIDRVAHEDARLGAAGVLSESYVSGAERDVYEAFETD
jgi:hypothetical protein